MYLNIQYKIGTYSKYNHHRKKIITKNVSSFVSKSSSARYTNIMKSICENLLK